MIVERIKSSFKRSGLSVTTGYELISKGLYVRPFKISKRSVAVLHSETDELIKARISGASDADVRILVRKLHDKRKRMAKVDEAAA